MEGDAPAHPANRAALRTGRSHLPAAAAAGPAPMGLRQPQDLIAPRRAAGVTQLAGDSKSPWPRPTQGVRHWITKAPAPRRQLSIPGPPPAALMAGRMVPSATLIGNIDLSPQASRIST